MYVCVCMNDCLSVCVCVCVCVCMYNRLRRMGHQRKSSQYLRKQATNTLQAEKEEVRMYVCVYVCVCVYLCVCVYICVLCEYESVIE